METGIAARNCGPGNRPPKSPLPILDIKNDVEYVPLFLFKIFVFVFNADRLRVRLCVCGLLLRF